MKKLIFAEILLLLMLSVVGCHHNINQAVCSEGLILPIARAGHAGGIVAGKIFIIGGNNWSTDRKTKNWLFDSYVFDDNSWKSGPVLSSAVADMMYAYNSTGLYVCGGTDGINKSCSTYLFKSPYTPPLELNPLPIVTKNGGAGILDDTFYVVCGKTPDGLTNKMWQLDTNNQKGTWRECSNLPGPAREYPAVVSCGDYIYVLGGFIVEKNTPKVTVLRDTYQYDPVSDTWEQKPDLPFGGYAWSASAIDNKYILLAGRAFEQSQISSDIWFVNTDDMSMRIIGKLQTQACAAPLVRVGPKTWWYIGGEPDANRSRTATVTIISLER